jgi:hypothetical protein
MLHTIKRAILLLLGSILVIGGGFIIIAGAVSGFGDHRVLIRIAYVIGGGVLVALGVYFYYLGSNKNLSKMFENILSAIITSFLP